MEEWIPNFRTSWMDIKKQKSNFGFLYKSDQALSFCLISPQFLPLRSLSFSLQEALLWPETVFKFSKIRFEYLSSALAVFCHLSHTTVKSLSQTSIQRPMNSHSVFQTHTHTHIAYWGKTDSQFLNHSHTASQQFMDPVGFEPTTHTC